MRKTNLDHAILRYDVKSGDRIRIIREVTVKDARSATLSGGIAATIVTTDVPEGAVGETLALTSKERVTLLERDVKVDIPKSAVIIYWQEDGEDYYARYDSDRQSWIEDDGEEYETTEDLAKRIEEYIQDGTFEVLKRRSLFSEGGLVGGDVQLGARSLDELSRALSENILPGRFGRIPAGTLSRGVVA